MSDENALTEAELIRERNKEKKRQEQTQPRSSKKECNIL